MGKIRKFLANISIGFKYFGFACMVMLAMVGMVIFSPLLLCGFGLYKLHQKIKLHNLQQNDMVLYSEKLIYKFEKSSDKNSIKQLVKKAIENQPKVKEIKEHTKEDLQIDEIENNL